jgi:hypothetical protein
MGCLSLSQKTCPWERAPGHGVLHQPLCPVSSHQQLEVHFGRSVYTVEMGRHYGVPQNTLLPSFSPTLSSWLAPPYHSAVIALVTSSQKPSLTTGSKISPTPYYFIFYITQTTLIIVLLCDHFSYIRSVFSTRQENPCGQGLYLSSVENNSCSIHIC